MMDEEIIKLECLRLAQTGDPDASIASAQKYFDWVVCKPKRGRPVKQEEHIDAKGTVRKHPS